MFLVRLVQGNRLGEEWSLRQVKFLAGAALCDPDQQRPGIRSQLVDALFKVGVLISEELENNEKVFFARPWIRGGRGETRSQRWS